MTPDGLAFTLYAPLAAMGDLAVGETRSSFDRPARSAILGIVAAALGYDRRDEAAHASLDRAYRLAQRVRRRGTLVRDYHTIQAPSADRKARWSTRKEALARPSHRLNTILSTRDYRADVWVDVALIRPRPESGGPSPTELAAALRQPVYTLYFGRKSCPLGRPPDPRVGEGVACVTALLDQLRVQPEGPDSTDRDDPFTPIKLDKNWADSPGFWDAPLFADLDLAGGHDNDLPDLVRQNFLIERVVRRRDRVASRRRWQFELRDEIIAWPASGDEAS